MRKRNRTVSFVFLFLLLFASLSYAQEKKYPPYPDVWGYELPTKGTSSPLDMVAKMPDGDYMITYTRERKEQKGKVEGMYKYAWILFFGGISKDFEKDEYGVVWKKITDENRRIEYKLRREVTFSDRSTIEYRSPWGWGGGGSCDNPFDIFFHKQDKDGKIVEEKMLLYLYDKPIKVDINQMCERNWGYKKDYYFKKVDRMYIKYLIPLNDDTFLILSYSPKSAIILRIDKNLNTKSDLLEKNIFLLDRKTFDEIRKKMPETNDQAVNDALSNYLTSLTRKEGKK